MSSSGPVTDLLHRWQEGDSEALEELTPLVYEELHRLAHAKLRQAGSPNPPVQTTELVNEAFLRLVDVEIDWQGRVHFYSLCARLMRRVLIDLARRHQAAKRGGGHAHETFEDWRAPDASPLFELMALGTAIDKLATFDDRKARLVELRYFAGLTLQETARATELSKATVDRELKIARAWLSRAMGRPEP